MIVDPRFTSDSNCIGEPEFTGGENTLMFLETVGAISSLSGGVNSANCALVEKSIAESARVEIPDGRTFR